MPEVRLRHFLPALMGSLHQQRAEGELVLEQNDGTRRLYWAGGDLVNLRSDAVGEQFGNFLIRRGVLDMASLKELLADGEGSRMGDRVVQWGLLTVAERDNRLHELMGSVLLHAMEHPILKMTWNPGALDESLTGEFQFRPDHRRLVWDTFQNAKIDRELVEMFRSEPDWRWEARPDLLEALSDLPLTPTLAYALSLLGHEALGYETIGSLSSLPADEAARLVATLWALGGLTLVKGDLPLVPKEEPPPIPPPTLIEPEVEPILLEQDDLVFEPHADPMPLPPPTPSSLPPLPEALDLTFAEPALSLPLLPSAAEEEALSPAERAHRLVIKAKSYMMQARTSEAIRALEQSIKLDGDSGSAYEAWLLLGRLRIGNPAWSTRAVEALQVASRINPRAAEPWALMGELYHRKGFQANAQGCFRRALELDPSVAVPSDYGGDDGSGPSAREGHGLMGKLKAMLGREKG
ncbi:hypothetical protein [Geothrix sp.]|uniref:hypothetical protein n=1 Tax=Geothrix sp. TaxID=1962974 RepID=UPI0025B7D030|nr:hypothetical protein [Geothrix sp.]